MASVRPFTGLRYAASQGPDLTRLIAPPYDVISPSYREELAARDPHNYVQLTLPEAGPDDRSQFVKYAKSAALLAEWRREDVLVKESAPAFYRCRQTFTIPGSSESHVRTALIALLKVEPYENGVVLPHEKTFPKHKADRLHLLEATRTHLESIFGLYEDPDGSLHRLCADAAAGEAVTAASDDGVKITLEPITDPAAVKAITNGFADKRVWIADGHHRYETALGFREKMGEHSGPIPEDYLVIALTAMNDPGLVLLPTHRIVPKGGPSAEDIKAKLAPCFSLTPCAPSDLMAAIRKSESAGAPALGLVLPSEGLLLTISDADLAESLMGEEGSDSLKSLDVSLLHRVALAGLLGLPSPDQVTYTRSEEEAIESVQGGGAAAAFLMEPPSVDDMRTLALLGEKMPQKSTYYYPKIMSGLVAWSLNDFE